MKLHVTTIEKLINMFETYGGHRNQQRLKDMLAELDLAEYERSSGERILVVSEDLEREQAGLQRK